MPLSHTLNRVPRAVISCLRTDAVGRAGGIQTRSLRHYGGEGDVLSGVVPDATLLRYKAARASSMNLTGVVTVENTAIRIRES